MADPFALDAVLDACAAGAIPPNIAVMRLITLAESATEVERALQRYAGSAHAIDEARLLWSRAPEAFHTVSAIHDLGRQPFERQGSWPAVFDSVAAIDPHAAVALYSLGDAELLERATKEIVVRLREWGVLNQDRSVLDFGCGTGRVAAAIAPLVQDVVAIDVSQKMVTLTRSVCAVHVNVEVQQADDLSGLGREFSVILAVDSMPYVVQRGCAEPLWRQIAASLLPGGALVIFNYSYRDDCEADQREIAQLAGKYGLTVERDGSADFELWDARTFMLRKPAAL